MLSHTSTNCVFCEIVNNRLPSTKIYEDNKCIAILSIDPQTHGHTLLIPKQHSDTWRSTSNETLQYLSAVSKKVMNILEEKYNATDFNIIVNSGAKSGQEVFHLHIHLIPRK